jgi:hypothetical protein
MLAAHLGGAQQTKAEGGREVGEVLVLFLGGERKVWLIAA